MLILKGTKLNLKFLLRQIGLKIETKIVTNKMISKENVALMDERIDASRVSITTKIDLDNYSTRRK